MHSLIESKVRVGSVRTYLLLFSSLLLSFKLSVHDDITQTMDNPSANDTEEDTSQASRRHTHVLLVAFITQLAVLAIIALIMRIAVLSVSALLGELLVITAVAAVLERQIFTISDLTTLMEVSATVVITIVTIFLAAVGSGVSILDSGLAIAKLS